MHDLFGLVTDKFRWRLRCTVPMIGTENTGWHCCLLCVKKLPDISRGKVATHFLRCGATCRDDFVTDLPPSLAVR